MILALSLAAVARAGTADALFDHVPPDAGMALVVEDLSEHARVALDSPLVAGLLQSRLVRDWLDSVEGRQLRKAIQDIETSIGAGLSEVRDDLLGEAVVLSLHLPPDASPDEARGLLQTRIDDRELLHRLLGAWNAAERAAGALQRIEMRQHEDISYSFRVFGDGRPDEAYALLDDGTFVWTNEERLLLDVLDHRTDPARPAMADMRGLDRVRTALPDRAMARLYVDPEFIARLAATDPEAPDLDELPTAVADTLGAIEAIGAALQWRDGPVLHVVEALDTDRLPAPIRSWAARPGNADALLDLVPSSSLAVAAGHIDLVALYDLIVSSIPEAEQSQVDHGILILRGLLMDRDPRSEVLPHLGPGVVGWLDAPPSDHPILDASAVVVFSIDEVNGLSEAITNGLRSALALVALDPESRARDLRVRSEPLRGHRVTALTVGGRLDSAVFAFAVGQGLLVLGNKAEAVVAVLVDRGTDESTFDRRSDALDCRDRYFPDASTFAYLDLAVLHRLADARRDELARALARRRGDNSDPSARDDLDRVLELVALFRGAYATSSLSPDGSVAQQRLGLIAVGAMNQ